MRKWLRQGEQPSLDEMLDDPIVRLLMKRDGVTRQQVEDLMRSLRKSHAPDDSSGAALPEQQPSGEEIRAGAAMTATSGWCCWLPNAAKAAVC